MMARTFLICFLFAAPAQLSLASEELLQRFLSEYPDAVSKL